jgi:ketosteroid isomerase-like protein
MKKHHLLIIVLSVGIVCTIHAQKNQEKEVAAAVENLRKAMIDGDKVALTNLVSDDLSYGHSSGLLEDKATFIDVIASGKNDFKTIEITETIIKFSGSVAIVRHKMKADLINNGSPSSVNIGVMQVWQKEKGKWRLVARQAFKLSP